MNEYNDYERAIANFYPALELGDEVLWASSPGAQPLQWRNGKVHALKNNACDIVVQTVSGYEYHHDCLYIDDPRCRDAKNRDWADPARGVFKLSEKEKTRRDIDRRFPQLEMTVRAMRRDLEELVVVVTTMKAERAEANEKWGEKRSQSQAAPASTQVSSPSTSAATPPRRFKSTAEQAS